MKKLLALLLALCLLSAGAYAAPLGDGESDALEATLSLTTPAPEQVVAVQVKWGDMQFTYTRGGWDA